MIGAITPKMENMIEKLGFSKKKKKEDRYVNAVS